MAVRCIECGSRDVEADLVDEDWEGDIYEYECNNCGEIFDDHDIDDADFFEEC